METGTHADHQVSSELVRRVGWAVNTIDVNIPHARVTAQVTLHGTNGAGTGITGIARMRKRVRSGADQDIDWKPQAGRVTCVR
jgi:hypothetical protein